MKYGSEPFVKVTIRAYERGKGHSLDGSIFIKSYDLPRELYHNRSWIPRWRCAWAQCRYPKHHIELSHCFYDRKTGVSMDSASSTYAKWVGAKAMVTKVINKMAEYKKTYTPTLYAPRPEDTEAWTKADQKLKEYEAKVILLENQLNAENQCKRQS